jgi:hypothetical protein
VKRDKLYLLLFTGLALVIALIGYGRHETAVTRARMCPPANANCDTPPGTPPQ